MQNRPAVAVTSHQRQTSHVSHPGSHQQVQQVPVQVHRAPQPVPVQIQQQHITQQQLQLQFDQQKQEQLRLQQQRHIQHQQEKQRLIKKNNDKKVELTEYFGQERFDELYSMLVFFR